MSWILSKLCLIYFLHFFLCELCLSLWGPFLILRYNKYFAKTLLHMYVYIHNLSTYAITAALLSKY